MPIGLPEIENRFGFHKATTEGGNATLPKHTAIRVKFRELAALLDITLPDGRAKSHMFTELETAAMWAHKAVAEEAPLVPETFGEDVLGVSPSAKPASRPIVTIINNGGPSYSGGNPDLRDPLRL